MELASSQQHNLSDLPIGALSHVSSYVPSSLSRALFAVALDYYRDNDSSSAIVGDQRDVLDCGDIETELAVKLNDDDVRNILLSIDAINNLKTLRLTNLLNITGIGLEPLRGSTMIEKIDLSLVGDHESCDLRPAPPISCTDVLPILDSIINMGECSLKLLIFPKEWRKERNTNSEFHAFLVRYNELLCSRVVTCLKCDVNLIDFNAMMSMGDYHEYGTQNFTCYDCMKHYCLDCKVDEDGENVNCISMSCGNCNRHYCLNCSRARYCTFCNREFCLNCIEIKECARCNDNICLNCASERGCRNNCCEEKIWCDYCVRHSDALLSCENCGADYCMDCYDNPNNVYSIDYCDECGKNLCGKCRVIKCKERMEDGCTGCYRFASPALLEDKERQCQQMQTEIDTLLEDKERQRQEMQAEIDEQRKEISELKEENGELNRKLKDLNGEVGEE